MKVLSLLFVAILVRSRGIPPQGGERIGTSSHAEEMGMPKAGWLRAEVNRVISPRMFIIGPRILSTDPGLSV